MSVVVITPPELVVDLATAKAHLRVDHDDDDALIGVYLGGAQGAIDGPSGWLGRAIGVQTLELRLASFQAQDWRLPGGYAWDGSVWPNWTHWPFDRIRLPYPPLITVTSITYEDLTGADVVLDESGWRALATADSGAVVPTFGDIWPAGRIEANAVRIRYQAGYATAPPAIVSAILMATAGLYANREDVMITDTRATQIINDAYGNSLAPFRVWHSDETVF